MPTFTCRNRIKDKKLMALGIVISLTIYAFYLSLHNDELMLSGSLLMFLCLLFLGLYVILNLNYSKNESTTIKRNFQVMIKILLAAIFINIFILGSFEYNYSKNVSSVLDYFMSSGGRKMENVRIDYETYLANLQPVFYDLLEGKKIYIDSKIIHSDVLVPIEGMRFDIRDLVVRGENEIDFYLKNYNPQRIRHYDTKENENTLLLFTGDAFEKAKEIYIVEINNYVCISSGEIINIDNNELHGKYERKIYKKNNYDFVRLEIHNDSSIDRVKQNNNYLIILGFMAFIFLGGFIVLIPFLSSTGNAINLIILLSFVVGSVYQIYVIITLGLVGIPINLYSVIITEFIFLLGWNCYFYIISLEKVKHEVTFYSFFVLSLVICIMIYFSVVPHVFMSYDSYMNILIGKKISYSGNLQENLGRLLMFSLVSPLWQTVASLFGVLFNYGMQPVFVVTGIMSLFYLQYEILINKGIKKTVTLGINFIVILYLFTVPEIVINFTWILNNLDIGIIYGIAVALMCRYFQSENKMYMILSYLLFIITGIARIEGGIFAVIYLIFIYTSNIVHKHKKILISCFTITYAILFTCNLFIAKNLEVGFWTPKNGALSLGLLLGFNVFVLCDRFIKKKYRVAIENIDYLMIITIILTGIVFSVINPIDAVDKFEKLTMNLVSTGYYGILIPGLLLILAVYSHCMKKISKETRMLLVQVVSYLFLIFVIMLFSIHNSRIGYGDSSCRMVLHIIPVCGILISNMLAEVHILTIQKSK